MKIVKRVLGICLVAVLASTLSILTTGVVVNTYIHSVLASFDIKVDTPGPGFGGMIRSIIGMDHPSESNADQEKVSNTSSPNKENHTSTDSPAKEKSESVDETIPDDALPVMGQLPSESSSDKSQRDLEDQQLVMTPEALSEFKDNLPSEEKVNIFNILMSKLPQEEMAEISKFMEDGLTNEEVTKLQQIIAKYVDPEEYESIMKMLTPTTEPAH